MWRSEMREVCSCVQRSSDPPVMKTSQLQKCPVCLLQYHDKNLDKHMHSRSHHETIEKLKGSPQIHKCLACGVSLWGMSQYGTHITTPGHITNLIHIQQNRLRGKGFTVDYTDDELAAVCDQRRLALKKKKRQQKKRMKALNSASKHVENGRFKKIKFAKKKTPLSTLQKPSLGCQTLGGGSSKQLEARIKEKSSPLMKPSCWYRLAAPNASFLQENKSLPRFGIETPSPSVVPMSKNTCGSQRNEASPGPSSEMHDGDASITEITILPMKTPLMKSKTMKSDDIKDAVKNVASLKNRTSGFVTEANALVELHGSGTEHHSEEKDDPESNNTHVGISKKTVREMLAMIRREEELKSYLDQVNSQLLLAQSALRVSLSNVLNLQEIKQQVIAEMGMLTSKNIEVLQRIQNSSLCGNVPVLGMESHQRVPDTSRQQQDQLLS